MKKHSSGRTTQPAYAVIRAVRPLFKHVLKAVESNLDGTGFTVPMRGMLERLSEAGPQTVPQLARVLLIPRQFAQQVANELREGGWVEQVANHAHKRSWLIGLTPEGEAMLQCILARELATIRDAAKGLSTDDLEACLRVLVHLTDAFSSLSSVQKPDGMRRPTR